MLRMWLFDAPKRGTISLIYVWHYILKQGIEIKFRNMCFPPKILIESSFYWHSVMCQLFYFDLNIHQSCHRCVQITYMNHLSFNNHEVKYTTGGLGSALLWTVQQPPCAKTQVLFKVIRLTFLYTHLPCNRFIICKIFSFHAGFSGLASGGESLDITHMERWMNYYKGRLADGGSAVLLV